VPAPAQFKVERHRIYDKVPEGQPYGSLDALLLAEIGCDKEKSLANKAQQMAADTDVKPGMTHKEAGAQGGRGNKKDGDNITSFPETRGSTGAAYLVRRLKRDHPAIAEALGRGEYPSARQAGIAAGIVKAPGRHRCGNRQGPDGP
jgi:hypothetical protein